MIKLKYIVIAHSKCVAFPLKVQKSMLLKYNQGKKRFSSSTQEIKRYKTEKEKREMSQINTTVI